MAVQPCAAYTQALSGKVDGLRLGVVQEGFGWEDASEPDIDESVKQSAHAFEKLGAQVKSVSIPWHRDGQHILLAIAQEGATLLMVEGNGMGTNWKGHYTTQPARRDGAGSSDAPKRLVRDGQAHDADRSIHARALSWPVLCEGSELITGAMCGV